MPIFFPLREEYLFPSTDKIKLQFAGTVKDKSTLILGCTDYKLFTCAVIVGELDSLYRFPENRRSLAFPKIVADFFSVPKTTYLLIQKHAF